MPFTLLPNKLQLKTATNKAKMLFLSVMVLGLLSCKKEFSYEGGPIITGNNLLIRKVTYNALGDSSVTTYTYDSLKRVIEVISNSGIGSADMSSFTTRLYRDVLGRVDSVYKEVQGSGFTNSYVRYYYNLENQLTYSIEIRNPLNAQQTLIDSAVYTYTGDALTAKTDYFSDTSRQFDSIPDQQFLYTYDAGKNIQHIAFINYFEENGIKTPITTNIFYTYDNYINPLPHDGYGYAFFVNLSYIAYQHRNNIHTVQSSEADYINETHMYEYNSAHLPVKEILTNQGSNFTTYYYYK